MSEDLRRWLFELERFGIKFGLDNMRALMEALGHPERGFRSVLVAGTNGKGSVVAVTETGLRRAGYRTACYTSPHLVRLEERFAIDGREVAPSRLDAALAQVRSAIDDLLDRRVLDAPPTFFEVTTAAAFELFRAARVDLAVIEVGLGGRLDATNVVSPAVCAITTIDMDHQAQLGTTIEAIAGEKAGIIKPGVPVVIGRLPPAAEVVVAGAAERVRAPLVRALDVRTELAGWKPALAGAHQVDNAIVALAILDLLDTMGFPLSETARRDAVEQVTWPGRLEHIRHGDTDVLLDAAHNPAGARALASYLRDIGWTDSALVFAAMTDKDAAGMLSALAPRVGSIFCATASTPRAERAAVLGDVARGMVQDTRVRVFDDPIEAFRSACATSPRVVVAGSMFLVGPVRGILR